MEAVKDEFFLLRGHAQEGPFTRHQLRSMWNAGSVTGQVLFWREGMATWEPLAQMQNFFEANLTPPPLVQPTPVYAVPPMPPAPKKKSNLVPLLVIVGLSFCALISQGMRMQGPPDPNEPLHKTVRVWLRMNLKDADSLEVLGWTQPQPVQGGTRIGVKYRAKNSLGAKVIEERFVIVSPSGEVSPQ
jgi:hypothetical protein